MVKKVLGVLCLLALPVFSLATGFSSFFGGHDGTGGVDVAVDSVGYVYICGYTCSTDMPVTPGAYQMANKNTNPSDWIGDIYVAKLDATLTHLIYCTYIGGTGDDYVMSMKVDNDGNVILGGYTYSTDFPVTAGAIQTTKGIYEDGFVLKLNPTGTGLVYSTFLGGNNQDYINEIAIDSVGNVFIEGDTFSSDLPVSSTAKQKIKAADRDSFVAKINSTGTGIEYLTYIGGNSYEYTNGIAIDSAGNAYIAGVTYSTDFPTTAGAKQTVLSGSGSTDCFATKVNPDGSDFLYSTYIGGTGYDNAEDISIDNAGNAYVVGRTNSTNYPVTTGAFQTTSKGSYDLVLTKINPTGSNWVYSTYLGGTSDQYVNAIAVDNEGKATVVGYSYGKDFPTTAGAYQETATSNYPTFMTRFAADGASLDYSTFLRGNSGDQIRNIVIDANNIPYLVGDAYSSDFPVTPNAFDQVIDTTNGDAFVMRFEVPFNTDPAVPVELSGFLAE
jgi:hypothetical protein